jgi:hypothetical protein
MKVCMHGPKWKISPAAREKLIIYESRVRRAVRKSTALRAQALLQAKTRL